MWTVYLLTYFFQVAALEAKDGEKIPIVVALKNNNKKDWSAKIEETGKFKIGTSSAFTAKARWDYIQMLINGFNSHPSFLAVSFIQLFDPLNGYANFQSLLNTIQVPSDLDGFYLNDARKQHLQSLYLSSP